MGRSSSVVHDLIASPIRSASGADLESARLGPRFSRLDLVSKLAVLAVEPLTANFGELPRDRIGICLAARGGSLSTDVEYWKGRGLAGGPSPTLFAYTLPSSAIGEIAIRHRLMGPNLCFFGDDAHLLEEAGDLLRRGEADGCVCVCCDVVSSEAGALIQGAPSATVSAYFLTARTIGSDTKTLAATIRPPEI